MSAKKKADSQVPAEESDLLLIRPLYVNITCLYKLQTAMVLVLKRNVWILTSLSLQRCRPGGWAIMHYAGV
jgi:hypothetical protein